MMAMALPCYCSRTLSYLRLGMSLRQGNGPPLFFRGSRFYSTGGENSNAKTVAESTLEKENPVVQFGRMTDHKVDRLEKYLLVWGGKFKSVSEVPKYVSQDTMERSRNKARIKINLGMVFVTFVACIFMIRSGKKAAQEGQSVLKMNQEWHQKVKDEKAE